jgi:FlaA1/EpsC-like NDP-sugar epimerase
MSPQLAARLRTIGRPAQQIADILTLGLAFVLAYLLRFDFDIPESGRVEALHQLPYVVLLQALFLTLTGVQTFIWRYVGLAEVKPFLQAALGSALPLIALRFALPDSLHQWRVPYSIILLDTMLAFGGLLGIRVMRRVHYEYEEKRRRAAAAPPAIRRPILLIGAGRAGVMAAREIQNRGDLELDIRGFVDDGPDKQGSVIQGIPVLGRTKDLPKLVPQLGIDHVVISIAEISRVDLKRITSICEQIPVKVRIIPGMYEILQGRVSFSRIRDVQIQDLLGRTPVQLDETDLDKLLAGRTVMVTGAGGSIGSELVRQIARFHPANLLLLDRAEFALFSIEREIQESCPNLVFHSLLADVGDEARIRALLIQHRPNIIIHAAAHKHVPMLEYHPTEAIKNNVLATRSLADLAGQMGVGVFVLISTDKAVKPKSVMGASKRVAEILIQNLSHRYSTRYVAVRFGNVIGSAGSVIPIFQEQIRKGGPVTVTHPDMVRYFMTIPEATQLVLQAAAMGAGGEIFILNMGQPVRILDLAKDTIRLSGLRPFDDIEIKFTGLRPGEKLVEELETTEDAVTRTRHPKIFIGRIARVPDDIVDQALERLSFLAKHGTGEEIRILLNKLVGEAELDIGSPTKSPAGTVRNVRHGHVVQMPLDRGRRDEPAAGNE